MSTGSAAWVARIGYTTTGTSEGHPQGVPAGYSWYGTSDGPDGLPGGYHAGTGWGWVNWNGDFPGVSGHDTVVVRAFRVWLHTSAGWQLAQAGPINGSAYQQDFGGNVNDPLAVNISGDASSAVVPANRAWHFYPDSRFTIPSGFDGHWVVTEEVGLAAADPSAHFLAVAGLDWWQTTTNPWPGNAAGGQSRGIVVPNDGSFTLIGLTDSAAFLAGNHP
jgi:hypothetical protein